MKKFSTGTSEQMLNAFQSKLDRMLEVPIEESLDVVADVTIERHKSYNYIDELAEALDMKIDKDELFEVWSISVVKGVGINVFIMNPDRTFDEYLVEADVDLTNDIEIDVDNIIEHIIDIRKDA